MVSKSCRANGCDLEGHVRGQLSSAEDSPSVGDDEFIEEAALITNDYFSSVKQVGD